MWEVAHFAGMLATRTNRSTAAPSCGAVGMPGVKKCAEPFRVSGRIYSDGDDEVV